MMNQDDLTKNLEKGSMKNSCKEKGEDSSTKADEDAFDSEKLKFNVQ